VFKTIDDDFAIAAVRTSAYDWGHCRQMREEVPHLTLNLDVTIFIRFWRQQKAIYIYIIVDKR
jgi:hypothetical protein